MHEIRATLPPEQVEKATRLARAAGIDRVAISDIYLHGPDARRQVVSVETSTPKARAFVEALLGSAELRGADYSLTSRELRAIVNGEDLAALTRPMSEPFPDVIQDLWQLSHLSASYVALAAAGAILLATGILDDNAVAIVVAALFLPFLAEVLAVSFGLWSRDRRLMLRGLRAIAVSTALTFAAGAVVATAQGGPIHFTASEVPSPVLGCRLLSALRPASRMLTTRVAAISSASRRPSSWLFFQSGWEQRPSSGCPRKASCGLGWAASLSIWGRFRLPPSRRMLPCTCSRAAG